MKFQRLPGLVGQGYKLVEYISVARVRPRTSKGITDLLLPQTSVAWAAIVPLRSWPLRSRSLTELTRQIAPPTKNGHAPPHIESRKSSQSVNPYYVWTWLHSWWCPSVNSFKFHPCDHTPPRTQRL
ncbi:hypothetical protein HN873_036225 [Arachis hypogaea]